MNITTASKVVLFVFLFFFLITNSNVQAQGVTTTPLIPADATFSAEASDAAGLATPSAIPIISSPSAEVVQKIQQQAENDITRPGDTEISRLGLYLSQNPPSPLSWYNVLQHAIVGAVANGLSPNIIVLIILFPIITAIIAISKHIIGLQGFGIYVPAVLSVAFVSTGIPTGIAAFITVLITAIFMRKMVKYLKLQHLPRTALLMWGVSVTLLILLLVSSLFNVTSVLTLSIFPLLIIMLLTENFMDTQLMSSQSKAIQLATETVLVAVFCALIIGSDFVQRFVISNPEFVIISVAAVNIMVGKYSGLRLLEYIRFKAIVEG